MQRLSAPNAISAIKLSKEVGVSQAALGPEELGAFVRREGVHEAELEQWRVAVVDAATAALEGGATRPSSRGADTKRIKELERQIRRKDKALAETAALLVLQKKSTRFGGTSALVRATCVAENVDPKGLVLHVRQRYPHKPFDTIEAARAWVTAFVAWYNAEHRHSGVRFVTPDERTSDITVARTTSWRTVSASTSVRDAGTRTAGRAAPETGRPRPRSSSTRNEIRRPSKAHCRARPHRQSAKSDNCFDTHRGRACGSPVPWDSSSPG